MVIGGGVFCFWRKTATDFTLQVADEEAVEDFARFVAVADVFEGFGGVLAADVEEDFFAAAVWVFLSISNPFDMFLHASNGVGMLRVLFLVYAPLPGKRWMCSLV